VDRLRNFVDAGMLSTLTSQYAPPPNLFGFTRTTMRIQIRINGETYLALSSHAGENDPFPTSHLQKGFLLVHRNRDLSSEAVGFGVPMIQCGLRTIFPGSVKIATSHQKEKQEVDASFMLNLEEKTVDSKSGKSISGFLHQGKLFMSGMIRHLPWFRKPLMNLSKFLRSTFHWKTEYLVSDMQFMIPIHYEFHKKIMKATVDLSQVKDDRITEIVIMNEQGAEYFNHYRDSTGKETQENNIGIWDEVKAPEASFFDPKRKISFSLKKIPGAKLFRGLEMVDSRLAWSGFGYTFSPRRKEFEYVLKIENK
jgi:hypothetical protein